MFHVKHLIITQTTNYINKKMTKGTYTKRIINAMKDAGTYQPQFSGVIDTLAGILENRDRAQAQYKEMKFRPVISHTNKSGAVNLVKNPALVIITELNAQALQYWRELGLTSKAYKAMGQGAFNKTDSSFEEVLSNIGI